MHDAPDYPAELELQRAFLQRLARQLVRGEAAAEDLVQDTFVRALERPPRSSAALRAWLGRVARHLALNRGRGARRSAARERLAARPEALPSHAEATASLELQQRVIAAVQALGEPYRTTLWLRYHEGLSPGAIAVRQETTKKTVEARVTRGLALLRAELDRQAGGDRTQWFGSVLLLARRPSAPWISTLVGVGVGGMMKKLAVAVVLLVVFGLAWRFGAGPSVRSAPEPATSASLDGAPAAAAALADDHRTALETTVPASAPRESRAGLRIRVRWSDGTPAPDVGLFVHPEDDPRGARAVQRLRSDAAGLARAEPVHPGVVRIEADRGGEREVTVRADDETEVVFELDEGLEVEGTVSDASGAPIAGAEVLLVSEAHDWLAMRVVAHTRADGGYAVRAVRAELSVTARAGDFRPALLRPLQGRAGRVRLDFVLDHEGAGLHGLVRDPRGRPVAGALVAVGDPQGWAEDDPEQPGAWLRARGLRVVETDVQGRFFAAGVQTGFGLAVAVQAEEYPLAVANVSAEDGASAFVEVHLEEPAVLTGFVRTSSGAPAAGVTLAATQLDGADADEIPFALPRATSDAEGRYRLELLPRVSVLRLDPPPGVGAARTLVALQLEPGETQRDLVLAEFADEAGLLPSNVRPEILLGVQEYVSPTWSEDGRFDFEQLRPGRYRLTIEHDEHILFTRWIDLAPGERVDLGRIVSAPLGSLLVDFDRYPSGGIVGSVLDDGLGLVAVLEVHDGRLDVRALPPGEWRLDLEAQGCGRISVPLTIRPGERTELRLALVPGVDRSLEFRMGGRAWETLRVELRDARGELVLADHVQRRSWPRAGGGPTLLVCLPVGTFALEAETDTGLALRTNFDVPALAPQDAPLTFELR